MDINEIVVLVLRIIFIVLTVFAVPWFKKKYDGEKQKEIYDKVMKYVMAAEQIYEATEGATKKAWVQEKLLAAGININLDEIDATIESCVLELHNALFAYNNADDE